MSINGSLSGITFGGLSSGIDTEGIISRLIQLEQIPIQRLQVQGQRLQGQQDIFGQFRAKIQSLNTAASGLANPLAFNPVKAASSKTDVASITANSGAPAGIYNLAVRKLAQAQKIASAPQASPSTAMNQSGIFVVNGKSVRVETSDTLQQIAQKITSAGAGVTASVIDGGAGRAYLTIASNQQGASNKVQLADVSGDVLSNVGMIGGAAVPRETVTNGITSYGFSSSTQTLDQLIPNTGLSTTSFQVNGNTVNVDFTVDSLQSLAAKITTAAAGTATASVRTVTDSAGKSTYKLDIISGQGGDTFVDTNNVLGALGFLQKAPVTELVQAQDAEFSLDGVSLTSSSNTVTTAIPGATLTLLKANETTPETSVISLTRDTDAIKQKIKDFADAFNSTVDFINQNSQFDKDSFASGPLFGDPVAQQVESTVANMVFNPIAGATGTYRNLAAIGFSVDDKGKLAVDDAALTTAINNSTDNLGSLFQTTGATTGANLTYIYAGAGSRTGTYNVEITAQPTPGSYVAAAAQTANTTVNETLTFNGALFSNLPVVLTIPSGSSQADIISLINNDSRLNTLVEASDDGTGKLKLLSKKAGSTGNFTVASDQPNTAGDTSGIGSGTDGVKVAGMDIQGTINGEPATGSPNGMLTGNTGNANTAGLQVQYTGAALGLVGTVTVGKGMAAMIGDLMTSFTDPVNGLLTSRDQSLTAQVTDITDQINALTKRIAEKQAELREKFTRMEETISRMQQQASRISQLNQNI